MFLLLLFVSFAAAPAANIYWQCVANAKLMTLSTHTLSLFLYLALSLSLGNPLLASKKFCHTKLCQTRHKMTGKCLLNDASETQKGTPAGFASSQALPTLPYRQQSTMRHAMPTMPLSVRLSAGPSLSWLTMRN